MGLVSWRRPAAVGALVVAAVGGWWGSHPRAFPEAGGAEQGATVPVDGERSVVLGVSWPSAAARSRTVAISSAEANEVSDGAAARVEVLLCTLDPSRLGAIGSVSAGEASQWCSTLVPARGVRLRLGADARQQLVVRVTPTRPGRVRIHGVHVRYRDGVRFGIQDTGPDIDVTNLK